MFKALYIFLHNLLLKRPELFCYFIYIITLTVIFTIIKHILQNKKDIFNKANKNNYVSVFKLLDYYYVYNIYAEILLLCTLILLYSGFFILLRIFNIGKIFSIWFIFSDTNNVTFINILFIIAIFFSMVLLFKITSILLKDIYFKIHLYLFQNKFYYDFIYDLWHRFNTLSKGLNIFAILLSLQENNQEERYKQDHYVPYKKSKLMYYFMDIFNKYYILLYLLKCCLWLFKKLSLIRFLETLGNKWPTIILYLIFVYDLKYEEIKYTYYMLLIFFIVTLYRKFRNFVGHLDMFELDTILVPYYYRTNVLKNHKDLVGKTEEEMSFECMDLKTSYIYYDGLDRILDYFNRGYIVDYVDIKFKMSYEPHSVRFLFIGILTFYYIFCYNLNFQNSIIISIPLVISIIMYEYAFYFKDKIKNKLKYIIGYKVFLLISIIIGIYIYLTRHTLYFFTDIIWCYGMEIKQIFNIDDICVFLERYSIYFIERNIVLTSFEKTELLYIITNLILDFKTFNISNMSIETLKTMMDNIIYDYIKLKEYQLQQASLFQEQLVYNTQYNYFILFITKVLAYFILRYIYINYDF